MFCFMSFYSLRLLVQASPLLILVSLIVLILVLVPGLGVVRSGDQRWLSFPFVFQPSEMAKVFIIIYFAHIYAKKHPYIDQFKEGVLPPLIILAIIFVFILAHPVFGPASYILFI